MKKAITLSSMFVLLLFAAFTFQSCSSGDIVEEYVDYINDVAKKIEKCDSPEDMQKVLESSDKKSEKFKESDHKLSDSDRKKIMDASENLAIVAAKKTAEFYGQSLEITSEMKKELREELEKQFKDCETLGDLAGK